MEFKKMFKYEPYFHKKAEKGSRKKKKKKNRKLP